MVRALNPHDYGMDNSLSRSVIFAASLKKRSWIAQLLIGFVFFLGTLVILYFIRSFGLVIDYTVTLSCAVIATIWGGFLSGFIMATLSAVWIDFFYSPPVFNGFEDDIRFAVYISLVSVVSAIMVFLRTALMEVEAARQEAIAQSRARERIVEIIAHDLKNPISSILLNVSLVMRIAEKKNWNENSIPKLRKTAKVALTMGRTISDLLNLAEMKFGKYQLTFADHNLAELVQKLHEWKKAAQVNGDTLQLEIIAQNESAVVRYDLHHLSRAIIAVLEVLFETVPKDRMIRVNLVSDADRIRIKIVAPGSLLHIVRADDFFGTYQTAEKISRAERMKVSLAKGISRAHGGSLETVEKDGLTQIFISISTEKTSNFGGRSVAA